MNKRPPAPKASGSVSQGPTPQALANVEESRCTNGCTNSPDSEHADGSEGPADSSDSVSTGSESPAADPPTGGLTSRQLAEAIAVLERLPLSDVERAEAIRRLLVGNV